MLKSKYPIGPMMLGGAIPLYSLGPRYRRGNKRATPDAKPGNDLWCATEEAVACAATKLLTLLGTAVFSVGYLWATRVPRTMTDDELLMHLLEQQEKTMPPDTEPKDPTDLPSITIFQTELESPFRIASTRELVLVLIKDSAGRVTGVRVDARLREETPSVRADRALDQIGNHVIDSGVAVLEVSAFAWSHVAGSLQWAARKVGASV